MMELLKLIEEIHTLNDELERFERKYGLMTETFYEWYRSGEEPEDDTWVRDFALWAGTYKLKLRRQEKYDRLVKEALAREDAPHLMQQAILTGAS